MYKLIIKGNNELNGKVRISGSKNSAVALIPAAILCDEVIKFSNVPDISDITALKDIITYLGGSYKRKEKNIVYISSKNMNNKEIPKRLSERLRASYYFMGALLGKYHKGNRILARGLYDRRKTNRFTS